MRKTIRDSLDLPEVQSWCLLGMSSTHRAIVRNCASTILASEKKSGGTDLRVRWKVVGAMSPETIDDWCQSLQQSDIALIDFSSASKIPNATQLQRTMHETSLSIRLLWCWGTQEPLAIFSLASAFAQGMIHNLDSLDSWMRSAFRKGTRRPMQDNALLEGIELPHL
jgi:hypothetical protein